MLRMTWKVWACPKRMHSPGINGEGELRGQLANPGSPGKWPLKRSVCVIKVSLNKKKPSRTLCSQYYKIKNRVIII